MAVIEGALFWIDMSDHSVSLLRLSLMIRLIQLSRCDLSVRSAILPRKILDTVPPTSAAIRIHQIVCSISVSNCSPSLNRLLEREIPDNSIPLSENKSTAPTPWAFTARGRCSSNFASPRSCDGCSGRYRVSCLFLVPKWCCRQSGFFYEFRSQFRIFVNPHSAPRFGSGYHIVREMVSVSLHDRFDPACAMIAVESV